MMETGLNIYKVSTTQFRVVDSRWLLAMRPFELTAAYVRDMNDAAVASIYERMDMNEVDFTYHLVGNGGGRV